MLPTQAVTCGLFIGCIQTRAHDHQVISLLCQNDVILHLSIFKNFWKHIFNLPLKIMVCYHSASLVMLNSDALDEFFYPTLTLMTIRIYIECEGRIEKSVPRIPFGITRLAE